VKKQSNRGLLWSFVVIFVVLLLDQILKIWVRTNMTLGQEIPVIGNWFKLLFIENNGMAFGWLGGGGALKLALSLFRIVAIVALFWVLVRLSKKNTKFGVLFGIALITAGAMGNIIDSVFYGQIFHYAGWLQGRVVDMLYFPIIDVPRENATWLPSFFFGPDNRFIFFRPIFNLADSAITIGVFYMLLFQWSWLKELK
jgi:signal peptidase II